MKSERKRRGMSPTDADAERPGMELKLNNGKKATKLFC